METDEARRRLHKIVAASTGATVLGIALPKSWIRPVVDAVILPAHAETSHKKKKKKKITDPV